MINISQIRGKSIWCIGKGEGSVHVNSSKNGVVKSAIILKIDVNVPWVSINSNVEKLFLIGAIILVWESLENWIIIFTKP